MTEAKVKLKYNKTHGVYFLNVQFKYWFATEEAAIRFIERTGLDRLEINGEWETLFRDPLIQMR